MAVSSSSLPPNPVTIIQSERAHRILGFSIATPRTAVPVRVQEDVLVVTTPPSPYITYSIPSRAAVTWIVPVDTSESILLAPSAVPTARSVSTPVIHVSAVPLDTTWIPSTPSVFLSVPVGTSPMT